MSRNYCWTLAALFICPLLLAGCGPDLFTPASINQATEGPLGGNWLLIGTLPASRGFNLQITLDEFGNRISGFPSVEFDCSGGAADPGINTDVEDGTKGQNGSFTLQSQTSPGSAGYSAYFGMLIDATSSTDQPAAWQGSFTSAQTSPDCDIPVTENFVATRIADFTGTYAGPVTMTNPVTNQSITATMTMTVEQGGTQAGTTQYSKSVMNGSLSIQGSPCVNSGIMTAANPSTFGGGIAILNFTMNDGSTWSFWANLDDIGASKVDLQPFTITGGSCGYSVVADVPQLARQ